MGNAVTENSLVEDSDGTGTDIVVPYIGIITVKSVCCKELKER